MRIDPFTVMLFALGVRITLGGLFLWFWFREERATWFAWWSGSFLFGGATGMLLLMHGVTGEFASTGLGAALLIAATACCWQGARAFDRRRPLWWAMIAGPAIWLAASATPGFLTDAGLRVILSSSLIAPYLALAAYEFWRGRAEALPSRWPVIVIFGFFAAVFAVRIPLLHAMPFPVGSLPMDPGWLGLFNLVGVVHTVLLGVLVVAMTKERLEFEQRTKAQTDPLTGAMNRRAFILRGTRLILRHQIENAPLCLLFLDLDHFKSLNDRFGHSGGDDVLMRFVSIVHDNIRPTDFLFRIGGEEFCCLLPHAPVAAADRVAERIRHQVEIATVDVAGVPVRTTVSIGIASTEAFGYDIEALMRRADMAVYTAKRQGRNRVVVATVDDAVENVAGTTAANGRLAGLMEEARSWKSA